MPHPLSPHSTSTLLRLAFALVVAGATTISIPASVPPAGAQSVCPSGTILGNATWGRAGTMVWENSVANQVSGASQTYSNVAGGVDLTVSYLDPANVNEDLDNPYLNYVAGDSWDAPVYTRTNGTYGSDYFTIVMNSLRSDQVVDWSFTFTKPVFVPDFQVSDIDWAGYGYNTRGIGTPHESFQDEVVLASQRGGNTIAFTATGGSGIIDLGGGQLTAGPYTPGVNGNVGPADAAGTAVLSPVGPVTSFNMQYSNGPDDAAADQLDGSPPAPSPLNSLGVANNHAVAINGFTVCAGDLRFGDRVWADVDGDGVQDPGEPGVAGVTVSISDLDGNLIETQITDTDGSYQFEQFPGFTWVISIEAPTGYTPTHDRDGGDPTSTAIDPTSDEFDIDFGLRPDPGFISGTILSDRNSDGILDPAASEVPLPGVTVNLTGTDLGGSSIAASATTRADGSYSFTDVPAGTYAVSEEQPAVGFIDGVDTPGTNAVAGGNDRHDVTIGLFESSTGNDFAEVPNSSIAGSVFEDADNDGNVEGGEPGIDGVDLALTGVDVFGNTVSLTAATQADGTYGFPLLISGTYTITESQPLGYVDGRESPGTSGGTIGADRFDGIALGHDVDAVGYDFGELPTSSISGSVTDDGANPIAGVTVELSGTDDLGGNIALTTTTAADGTYVFLGLRPGSYTLTETQPAAYGDGPEQVGTVNGLVEGSLGSDVVSSIDLGVGEDGVDYDFTETGGSLAGTVIDDRGAGIADVTITLTGADAFGAPVSASTVSGADGRFEFVALVAGNYTLAETQPAAYGDGDERTGSAGGNTTIDDTISAISLGGGDDATGYEFAETRGSLSGLVFVDPDNDGAFGTTGSPEPGATVSLTGTDILGASVSRVVTTATDGTYRFDGLLAGTYTLDETQPVGLVDGIDSLGSVGGDSSTNDRFAAIVLGPGVAGTDYDFAELPPAGITGTVADDTGAPIGAVTITLSGTTLFGASITATTATAPDGTYRFFELPPGTYRVDQTQPIGYGDGPDTAGTVNGTTNGTAGDDQITDIALGPDEVGIDYDFTETLGSISGEITDDGGNGISGVQITLTGTDDGGTIVTRSSATAGDGTYSFAGLLSGTYAVSETQPPAYGDGGETAGSAGGDATTDDVIRAISLPAGADATGYDFDETRGSIRGRVYEDRNNNGNRNRGEPGISGVTITLTGIDVDGGTVTATTTTNTNGVFRFNRLLAGRYTVTEVQPVGYLDGAERAGSGGGDITVDDEFSAVLLTGGAIARPYQFGELAPASISGTVFRDLDASGSLSGSEPGISGVVVSLSGTDDRGAAANRSMTSTPDGTYSFVGLRPGSYTLTETQPPGYLDGIDAAGTVNGATVGDTSVNDMISAIDLESGTDAIGYDFAELEGASISGTITDDGANPIPNVTLTITGTDDLGATVNLTTTTATDGTYTFTGLRPGTYTLTETQPAAYGDGGEAAGTINGTTVGVATNDRITAIALGSGDSATGYDFDETRGSISGNVYEDVNGNGTLDPGEPGIGGITIRLTGTNTNGATVTAITTTTPDGSYRFTPLLAGSYTMAETQPTTHADGQETVGSSGGSNAVDDIVSSIPFLGGSLASGYDFGEVRLGTLSGTVYADDDNSGSLDPGERGIDGAVITLTGTDDLGATVNLTTTTATDGTYTFTGLRPGTYTVLETQPAGYLDGRASVGSAGGTATTNRVIGIVASSGGNVAGYDFGELEPAQIGGTVIDDRGRPIPGVTISLDGADDLGTTVARSTTTAFDGSYSFDLLQPGTYRVSETQPIAYGDGGETAGTVDGAPVGDDSSDDTVSRVVVASGQIGVGYDFDERTSVITGQVFVDVDGDTVPSVGDRDLQGVTVTLSGTDINGGATGASATTRFDGSYRFDGLLAGTYTLVETQPSGYLDGIDSAGSSGGSADNSPGSDTIAAIPLAAGATSTDNDFGEVEAASIGGTIIDDAGNRIPGVTVSLDGVDHFGSTVTMTTATGAGGTYSFDQLAPGTYRIRETQPAAYGDGGETVGTVDGATTGTSSDDQIEGIVLTSGSSGVDYDFDEVTGALTGSVVQTTGTGDVPIGGVDIHLSGVDVNGVVVSADTTTTIDGTFRFDGLVVGDYTIAESQPAVFVDGPERVGSAGGDDTTNDVIATIVLAPGATGTGYVFTESGTVLSGRVWLDRTGDGLPDPTDDLDLGGITIELISDTGATVTTTSAPDGTYAIGGLVAGGYTVRQTQPAAWGSITPNDLAVTLPVTGIGGIDFGEQAGAISGTVFGDENANGIDDQATPQVGVVVTLSTADTIVATATTDIDGNFDFGGLPSADYIVTVTAPNGTMFTTTDSGTDDTIDSDVAVSTGQVTVELVPGGQVTDIDTGIVTIEQDLAIEVTTSATDLEVGDDAPFDVRVRNSGNVPIAGGVTVTLPVPADTTFVSAAGDGWTIVVTTDGSVTATSTETLAPGEAAPVITLVVEPTRPGEIRVTGNVTSSAGLVESTTANNVSSVPATVNASTTSIPNLAYTGSSLLLLLLIAGGLVVSGRTLTLIGAPRRRNDGDRDDG